MKIIPRELNEAEKALLMVYPIRNPMVEVEREDGKVVLIYKKSFSRFERWLHKLVGGPENIRRPLDDMGTEIWDLCDGEYNIGEICRIMDDRYHEKIEPVLPRIWGFIEMLLKRNLVYLEKPGERGTENIKPPLMDEGEPLQK